VPSVGPDFTIVALPDTQFYTSSLNGGSPSIFISQTEWILGQREARNIVFVTQLGDCTQNGDTYESEWWNATNALYRLEDPARTLLPYGLPYGVAVGNHDSSPIGSATGTTTFYNRYFGTNHFAGRPYYGGNYDWNNDEHYELFTASGINFIIIHLEWDSAMTTTSPELDWADQLLRTFSDRQAIIVSHYLMNSGENGSFGTQGAAVYNRLKVNPNLFLMLCGHVNPNGEGKRTDVYNGRTVYTVLSDYQDRANGGNGWLRLMEFSPANNVIRVRTYSPTLNQYETDANSQFDLPYDMQGLLGAQFTTVAVNTAVPSGSSTTAALADLATSTEYEWYVTVSDGTETITSPTWRFRTTDVTAPAAPSGLAAAAQSSTEILLTWTDNANNETGFEVYQSTDGVNFSAIGTVAADATNVRITGLQAGTTYHYFVRAFNGTGYSADSEVASATTQPPPPPPSAPSALTATATTDTDITLAWTDNADNETGFRIERSTDGINFTELPTGVSANITVFSDSGLTPQTTYHYRVRAVNDGGSSDYSNVATATTHLPPPPAPTGFAATPGNYSVTLSWSPTPNARYYQVYRAETSGGPYFRVGEYQIFETTWTHAGLTPYVTGYYVVSAFGDGGESAYSEERSATPYALPAPPTGATITGVDMHALGLAWIDQANDETGFRIERSIDNANFLEITNLPADTTAFWDEGLADNTTYFYRIRAFNNDGASAPAEVSGTTLIDFPDTPTGLTATAGNAQVSLAWLPSARAASYIVWRATVSGGPYVAVAGEATETNYLDTTVVNGTTYFYVVSAQNAAGESAGSVEASATPLAPPAAPTGLAASAQSSTAIGLTWTDVSDNEAAFQIEQSLDGTTFALIGNVNANTTAAVITDLAVATTYFFRVRAVNAGGVSEYSAVASATTFDVPPSAPASLSVSGATSTSLDLGWSDTSGNETGFRIEQSTDGLNFSEVLVTGANITTATIGSLQPATTYYFRVRAFNAFGESAAVAASGTTLLNPPAAPTTLNASATNARVNVAWSAVATATSYNVKRALSATGPFALIATTTATSHADTTVANGTSYFYVVSAVNSGGEGPNSPVAGATPQASPNAPSNLRVSSVSSSRLDLSWTDNSSNETGFKIERASSSAGPFTQIATVGANVRTFSNTGLTPNTTYYYRVRAFHAVADSAFSNTSSGKTKR